MENKSIFEGVTLRIPSLTEMKDLLEKPEVKALVMGTRRRQYKLAHPFKSGKLGTLIIKKAA